MSNGTEALLKKTQRGLSILAFETTKQSRILKKRMRIAALQKEIKADLRDLGNLVYNAVVNNVPGILGEEEVKILVQNIQQNKIEVERLRDSISRLGRAKKHFSEEEAGEEIVPSEPDGKPAAAAESGAKRSPAVAEESSPVAPSEPAKPEETAASALDASVEPK